MTRDDIIKMAREAGAIPIHKQPKELALVTMENIERFFHMAQAAEREECAKVCAQQSLLQLDERVMRGIDVCTDAIRARGQA